MKVFQKSIFKTSLKYLNKWLSFLKKQKQEHLFGFVY